MIPTLEEYLSVCNKYDKTAIVEIKCDMTRCADKLIETVKQYHYLEKTVFISFGFENLVSIRKILPDQKLQYLCCDWKDEMLSKLLEYKMDLDISQNAVTKELITLLHQNKIEINSWTVDSPETAEKFVEWGIDYLTTNILEQN